MANISKENVEKRISGDAAREYIVSEVKNSVQSHSNKPWWGNVKNYFTSRIEQWWKKFMPLTLAIIFCCFQEQHVLFL